MRKITLIGFETAVLTNDIKHLIEEQLGAKVDILNPDSFLNGKYDNNDEFLITYQTKKSLRQEIIGFLNSNNLKRATFVHASSIVDRTAVIHPGTFVGPFCTVGYQTVVESDCLVSPYTMLAHRAVFGEGSTKIGKHCSFGLRSTIIDKLEICDNVSVGAGSLVTKNIAIPGMYVGSPARKVADKNTN